MTDEDQDDTFSDMSFAEFTRQFPKAAREMMRHVMPLINCIIERQADTVAKWGAIFALDCHARNDRSMADIAAQFRFSKAAISHEARLICSLNGLSPSAAMKTDESVEIIREARNGFVKTARMKPKTKKAQNQST